MYSNCHLFYSIYTSRPVYSFQIHNNKWQCNSFFCTKKETFWDFEMQKKFFCVRTQPWTLAAAPHPPDPPCTQLYAFGLIPPLLLCEYVLCGWPPNKPTDGGGGRGGLLSFKVLSCGAYWKVVLKRRML